MKETARLPEIEATTLCGLRDDLPELRQRILALRRAGWTLQSIGTALGKGRSTVRMWEQGADPDLELPSVPSPPVTHSGARVVKLPIDVPVSERESLRSLAETARSVRGWTPVDAPERRASRELNDRLRLYTERGVSTTLLAQRIDVTYRAVRARLDRSAA